MPEPKNDSPKLSFRPAWAEIDSSALGHNLAITKRLLNPDTRIYQVCKGDGYGFGAKEIAVKGDQAGVDGFCAGSPEEAIAIRQSIPQKQILLFASTLPVALPALTKQGITVTVNSIAALQELVRYREPSKVFLEMECGFGRFGVSHTDLPVITELITKHRFITCQGIYTHLGKVDNEEKLASWLDKYVVFVSAYKNLTGDQVETMVASSHLILSNPSLPYDAVDPGRLLYGIIEKPLHQNLKIRPVLKSIKSRIIQLTPITEDKDTSIGYGDVVSLRAGSTTAVFPLGWWDGLSSNAPFGNVLISGKRVKIIGRTLQHSIVDVSDITGVSIGDEVVLVGSQGNVSQTLEEFSLSQEMSLTELHFRLVKDLPKRESHI